MRKIKTLSEACEVLGLIEKDLIVDFSAYPDEDREGLQAHADLLIMTKAMNHDESGDQIWYPYFWRASPSGGGFRFYGADGWHAFSLVGARLSFKSEKAAEWAGKNWTALYEKYHTYLSCAK